MRRDDTTLARWFRKVLLVPLLVVSLPILVVIFAVYGAIRLLLHFLILLIWLPKGKDILLVYSDSPIWHEYMTTQIVPLVKERAVILNWSERKEWSQHSLAVIAFRVLGGKRNFNPLVIFFRPFRPARLFRFWSAFRDWKHGDIESLERMRRELQEATSR